MRDNAFYKRSIMGGFEFACWKINGCLLLCWITEWWINTQIMIFFCHNTIYQREKWLHKITFFGICEPQVMSTLWVLYLLILYSTENNLKWFRNTSREKQLFFSNYSPLKPSLNENKRRLLIRGNGPHFTEHFWYTSPICSTWIRSEGFQCVVKI